MAYQPEQHRLGSAAAALFVGGGLFAVLLAGLYTQAVHGGQTVPLATFDVSPPPPPPPEPPPPRHRVAPRPKQAPAPAGLRARATDLVLPPPVVPVPPPPVPIVSAPAIGPGTASHAGNSDSAGPGPGAGGEGNGTGGGGSGGNGDGDVPPELVRGHVDRSDFPGDVRDLATARTVYVRYRVDTKGRVPECLVTRSSGLPRLDGAVCDAIRRRFRFRPGHDGAGRPFDAWIVESYGWDLTRGGPRPRDEPDYDGDQ